jgi:hypothetical protein
MCTPGLVLLDPQLSLLLMILLPLLLLLSGIVSRVQPGGRLYAQLLGRLRLQLAERDAAQPHRLHPIPGRPREDGRFFHHS